MIIFLLIIYPPNILIFIQHYSHRLYNKKYDIN
nr:MAG TPA: hypothetical protein [Caudoviricetes sp.]